MDYRDNYVPKVKKVNYRIVVPFLVLVLTLAVLIAYLLIDARPDGMKSYEICNLDVKESQQLVKDRNAENIIKFKDYGVYGQSLGIYQEPYNVGNTDAFDGRTLFINNLCTDKEQHMMMGSALGDKLPLNNLEPGFYEIMILDGFTRARLVSDNPVDETFTATTKDGTQKNIRLLADKMLFNADGNPLMDNQYLFLEVKNKELTDTNNYDVILDPTGLIDDFDRIFKGIEYQGFIESKEMMDIAQGVEKRLTDAGYRALISRDAEKAKDIHGLNGRIHRGYLANAKYYINLSMAQAEKPQVSGATAMHSSFGSKRFATSVMSALTTNTDLKANMSYDAVVPGVIATSREAGLDYNNILRETGGRFTGAGILDPYTTLNHFGKTANQGMEGLILEFGYITNPETYQTWFAQKEKIIEVLSDAIMKELGTV